MASASAMGVVTLVNERFACGDCKATHAWLAQGRALHRQNSSIHRLRCSHCGAQVVAKVARDNAAGEPLAAELRTEYATLRALQSAFPQDEHFGTLQPLGFVEAPDEAVMLTRLFPSRDLVQHLHAASLSGVATACTQAGVWLRKLHASAIVDPPTCTLGIVDKLEYLDEMYAEFLRNNRTMRRACELLTEQGATLVDRVLPAVRQHGDFKPENLLVGGSRHVGLDIDWKFVGAPEYDLAPFLNHLWLAQHRPGTTARRRYGLAEAAFLAGYGYGRDLRALRWVQLNFALCHAGRYCRRGRHGCLFSSFRIAPLVRELSGWLRGHS